MTSAVTQKSDLNVTVVPVYFPESGSIQVHQSRICPCPLKWPTRYYWYGGKHKSTEKEPRWMKKLIAELSDSSGKSDKSDGAEK